MVQLLRPLLQYDGFPSYLIEQTIWNHTQQGLALLGEHYKPTFTCQRQPVLQMFSVLHLTDIIARFFPGGIEGRYKSGPEAIKLALEVLEESKESFPVAGPFKEMVVRTAKACTIRTSLKQPEVDVPPMPRHKAYQLEDFVDAFTRPSYVQPIEEIRQRYLPSMSNDWLAYGSDFGFFGRDVTSTMQGSMTLSEEETGAENLMRIRSLLNSN